MVTTRTVSAAIQEATTVAAGHETGHVVSLMRAGAAQTLGGRNTQEDALDIMIPADPKMAARGSLFILAEGAGLMSLSSHSGKMVARQVREAFYGSFCYDAGRALRSAIVSTNRTLHKQGAEKLGTTRAGVRLVAATVQGDKLWLAGAGQVTVYLLSARTNVLHRIVLGQGPRNDQLGLLPDIEPEMTGPLRVGGGDLLMLSSDGLHNLVPEEIVKHYMTSAMQTTPALPAGQLATALVNAARFREAADNATALVLRCHGVLPTSAAAEYGWPSAYTVASTLPADGETQSGTVHPTLSALTGLAPRPQDSTTMLTTTGNLAAQLPAELLAEESDEAQAAHYVAETALVETVTHQPASGERRSLLRSLGRRKHVAMEQTKSSTVSLAPLPAALGAQTGKASPLRTWQRVAGWLTSAGAMTPLVAAIFIEPGYMTSPEGVFFLSVAAGGVVCSMDAAKAIKRAKGGGATKKSRKRRGSAGVAVTRLTGLQQSGADV